MKLKNKNFEQIQNIVFDFGNVLLDIDIQLTVNAFAQLGLKGVDPKDIHPHNLGIFLDLEVGKVGIDEFVDSLQKSSGMSNVTPFEIYNAWNMMILPFDYGRFELLDKLRERYRVLLLSNTNRPHREYFVQRFNAENPWGRTFESFFDGCYYSDEMKMRKPDREIYQAVLEDAEIEARESLFIDDNSCNLDEPRKMGWSVHHLVKPETVSDLFE